MIKLAIVGTGSMANAHARIFNSIKSCKLVAVCDIDKRLAKAFARKYEIPEVYTDVDEMLADFLVHYEANIAVESRPFPGALAALDQLASAGARLAVCTNKREHLTLRLLAELGLEDRLHGIAGRDTFHVAKPDPARCRRVRTISTACPEKACQRYSIRASGE